MAPPARFDPKTIEGVRWLADLVDIPDDSAWPRLMSPVHPDAWGSYGQDVEEWLLSTQGIELRHWQKLATRRMLEHDASGRLLWSTIVESCSRRVGKSTRLRGIATWRMAHQDLFGEPQLVIHTGSDLAICREVQQKCWRWAEQTGWGVTRGNGKEALETPTGDRWLVRSQSAVYGWDTTFGMVDEGWDVASDVVDEGLEPSLIEREQPQLILTSTAHRRATPLMRRRIASAVSGMGEDWTTLLMVWGADESDDIGDPDVWKAASAYWSPSRAKTMADKYERALRGEADPEVDDPDPLLGWAAQYLNRWPPGNATVEPGTSVLTETEWSALGGFVPQDAPMVVAVESWYNEGACAATAYTLPNGRAGICVRDFPDVPAAAAWVASCGASRVLAGKSIAKLVPGSEAVGGTTRQAVLDLRRMVDDHLLTHDDSQELSTQVLALRTTPSPEGPRVVSKTRADALKAMAWSAQAVVTQVEVPMIF